jgi:dolichol-phosphate mannosyltransferase
MIVYAREKFNHLIKLEFIRFCMVGGVGFLVNLLLLTILHRILGLPIFLAQLISAEIALFINFMLHHHWTYKSDRAPKSIQKLLIQFHATTWPAILGSALMVSGAEKFLHFSNLLALATSSIIALLWNFCWTKYVIWKKVTPSEIEGYIK